MPYHHLVALYFKELTGYFYSLLSYIFLAVFLLGISWFFWEDIFVVNQITMRTFFAILPWFFLFLIPALSMRLWSEEKRFGTLEALLTLPVSDIQAVLAKFAAVTTFLGLALITTLPLPLILDSLGELDWGVVIGSYIGAWFLGSSLLALGQWISSMTRNQIVSFLLTFLCAFILIAIGMPSFVDSVGKFAEFLYLLSAHSHFQSLAKGVLDLQDIVYYLTFIFVFLALNVLTLQRRKYF